MFLLPLLMYFGCYGNLKFPFTYNVKSAIWVYFIADILTKSFSEMLIILSGPLPNVLLRF